MENQVILMGNPNVYIYIYYIYIIHIYMYHSYCHYKWVGTICNHHIALRFTTDFGESM